LGARRASGDDLAVRGVKLQLGTTVHDPSDPMASYSSHPRHVRGIRGRPDPDA